MAVPSTPHTSTQQDANSAQDDLDPNMDPQDTLRADAKLYENMAGSQTGGTRAFNANAERDNQPKSIDGGTGNTRPQTPTLPTGAGQGVTNSPASKERDTQEKLIGK